MRHWMCLTSTTVNQLFIITCSLLVVSVLSFSPVQNKYRIHHSYRHNVHYIGQQTTKKNQKDSSIIFLNAPVVVELSLHSSSHDIPRTTNQSLSSQEFGSYKKKPGKDGTTREMEARVNQQSRHNRPVEFSNSTVTNKRQQIKVRLQELNDHVKNKVQTDMLNQSYYDDLVATLVSYDEWESVLEVQDIMKEQGYKQIHSTYKACLQACYNTSNAGSASEILSTMEQTSNIQPDSMDIGLVVLTLCRKHRIEKGSWYKNALQLVKRHQHLPIQSYNAVLSCLMENKQWQESIRLLRSMEEKDDNDDETREVVITTTTQMDNDTVRSSKTLPVVSTYGTVIECCVRCDQLEQAVQIIQSSLRQKNAVIPAVYTFELVITGLCKKLQWRRAVQIMNLMDQYNVTKTLQIYNSVILACAKTREISTVKHLLYQLRKESNSTNTRYKVGQSQPLMIRPTIATYNAVMAACASTSEWKEALNILDIVQREPGVTPDLYTYTNAIRACAKGGQVSRALALFQVVKDKRMVLDNYVYTAAIEACSKGLMWQKALELLDDMEKGGIKPSEVTFSVTISACGNCGQWEMALSLLSKMRDRKMPINLYVYNAAITAISKAAKRRIGRMDENENNKTPDLYTEIKKLLSQMEEDGIQPDGFTYSSAISCFGSEGRWQEALDLIRMMQNGGERTQPNKVAYTAAITSCGRSGQADYAIDLFGQMKSQGLYPDRVAYNALFSALRISKRSNEAFNLWDEMMSYTKKGISVPSYATVTPDIITVTDAIAAMSSQSNSKETLDKVDKIFAEAVRLKLVLRSLQTSKPLREIDLSGMSFPVARAACRYIFHRSLSYKSAEQTNELVFITGVGASHDDGSSSLRDFVQEILVSDFNPPIASFVPEQERSTVHVKPHVMKSWLRQQKR